MGVPPNWLFSVFSFISVVLCLIPFSWHLDALNTGTCMFMVWTALGALNFFINSVVWNSDAINKAPVWCDISSQISIAMSIGIPASCLCISRRLFKIASVTSVTTTRTQRRRAIMVDLAIGIGLPALELALHPIIQAHRFVIYEGMGCVTFNFNTPPAYPIYFCWPLVISLISASYTVRTIHQLAIRRAQFREFLSTNKNLSASRYFRLMGLAGTEIVFTIPLSILALYLDVTQSPIEAWESWSNSHANFDMIYVYPADMWQSNSIWAASVELLRWDTVICAFVFFGFFGFADEAWRNYRLAYASVAKRVGLSTGAMTTSGSWTAKGTNMDSSYGSNTATMPVYVTHETEKKRDSFASFASRMTLPDLGDALADVKKGPFSPITTSSGNMSRESLPRSPIDFDSIPLPTLPEASLDSSAPPRYTPDVPHAV